jgi:hypothetical protein
MPHLAILRLLREPFLQQRLGLRILLCRHQGFDKMAARRPGRGSQLLSPTIGGPGGLDGEGAGGHGISLARID